MSIKEQIDRDIKQAMLAGHKTLVTTLRGLKSAILYIEVAKGARDSGLPEDEVIALLSKEARKRQESADLYIQGGGGERAEAELAEKKIIENYLPAQLSEEELRSVIAEVINQTNAADISAMGQVIGQVKDRTKGSADGALIARLVKEKLS
jgi:uncharacterized protein